MSIIKVKRLKIRTQNTIYGLPQFYVKHIMKEENKRVTEYSQCYLCVVSGLDYFLSPFKIFHFLLKLLIDFIIKVSSNC